MNTMNEGIIRNACNIFLLNNLDEIHSLLDENFASNIISIGKNPLANMTKYELKNLAILFYNKPNSKHDEELVVVQTNDAMIKSYIKSEIEGFPDVIVHQMLSRDSYPVQSMAVVY